MKSISYTQVSADQAVRDFCRGRVLSIFADGEFWCAIERAELRCKKARKLRHYARIVRREVKAAQKYFGGPITFKTREAVRN